MACYAVLALLAGFTLQGPLRIVVWIVLAGLAVKTWTASRMKKFDTKTEHETGDEPPRVP